MKVIVIGAGIGGLTLALALHQKGIECDVYESVAEIKPIGVGVNILPHASRILCEDLGLEAELTRVSVTTQEASFYNQFGQEIYTEPAGRFAGYNWPQFSIHRGDLQMTLLNAFLERVGRTHLHLNMPVIRVEEDHGVAVFKSGQTQEEIKVQADCVIACDGLHSVVRKQFHPNEGAPKYSGVNMWRGVTPWKSFLKGANMVRAGWLSIGKMVIYPIRNNIDEQGNQLINWVAEVETPKHLDRDWNRLGRLEDFIHHFDNWHFDWLDVPALIRSTKSILEFPMIDQDPLPWWNKGRVTLLGDAAHPMYPRGSNGAGQAIIDAAVLAKLLAQSDSIDLALKQYQEQRLEATSNIVLMNRVNPPDAILREVHERSNGQPFNKIEDIISKDELVAISQRYQAVAGYDKNTLNAKIK